MTDDFDSLDELDDEPGAWEREFRASLPKRFNEFESDDGAVIVCKDPYFEQRLAYEAARLQHGCESPIERKLAARMIHQMALDAQRPPLVVRSHERWRTKTGFTIAPQWKVGSYRADFAVALSTSESHPGGCYTLKELPHSFYACLIVECDGHDFHERTKEQAARDKRRDRFLLEQGWPVIRFTGSEIHVDPGACTAQIITSLRAIIARQERETRRLREGLQEVWAERPGSPWAEAKAQAK